MDNIKISAVLLMSGIRRNLKECIDSLLRQTLKEFEIIVINDRLEQSNLELILRYGDIDNRIKIINRQEEDTLLAKKFGLEAASGDYLFFIDINDTLKNDAFEKLYKNIRTNKSDIAFSDIAFLENNKEIKKTTGVALSPCFETNTNFLNFTFTYKELRPLVLNRFIATWNKLYKTSFLRKHSKYLFSKQNLREDSPFQLQLILRSKKLSFCSEKLYNHRVIEASSNIENNIAENLTERLALVDKVKEFFRSQKQIEDYTSEFLKYVYNDFAFLCATEPNSLESRFYDKMKCEFKRIMKVPKNLASAEPCTLDLYNYILSSKNSIDSEIIEKLESLHNELENSKSTISKHEYALKRNEVALKAQRAILEERRQELEEQNLIIAQQGRLIYRRTEAMKKIKNSLAYKIAKSITKTANMPAKLIKKLFGKMKKPAKAPTILKELPEQA